MVGGKVIGLSRRAGGTLLHVQDRCDLTAVRCVEVRQDTGEPVAIAVGDSVWWQGRTLHWNPPGTDHSGKTPRFVNGKATYDIPLTREF